MNRAKAETFFVTETPKKLKKAIEKRAQIQAVISIPKKKKMKNLISKKFT